MKIAILLLALAPWVLTHSLAQSLPSSWDDDHWMLSLSCSANTYNQRPAFSWEVPTTVRQGLLVYRRTQSDPKNTFEELWKGSFNQQSSETQFILQATGKSTGGDTWSIRFKPVKVDNPALIELSGGVFARDQEKPIRVCAAKLRRDVVPKPEPVLKPEPAPKPNHVSDQKNAALENITLFDHPGMDIALVTRDVSHTKGLIRSLEGGWVQNNNRIGVGYKPLTEFYFSFGFEDLPSLSPKERKNKYSPLNFYQKTLFYPQSVPSVPSEAKKIFNHSLGRALEQAFSKIIGKPARFTMDVTDYAEVVLVPRFYVDAAYNPKNLGDYYKRVQSGDSKILGFITQAELRAGLEKFNKDVTAYDQAKADLMQRLKATSSVGHESLIGSISLSNLTRLKPCVLKGDLDIAPYLLDHPEYALWVTKDGKNWSYDMPIGFDTAEELFAEAKNGRKCTDLFGRGPLIAAISEGLVRDGVGHTVYDRPQTEQVVIELKAKSLGFDDVKSMTFAQTIGARDSKQISALKAFGIDSSDGLQLARDRLKKFNPDVQRNLDTLIFLLNEESEAKKQGVSIERLQADRRALAEKQAKNALAAQKELNNRIAKDYPFIAVLRCRIQDSVIPLQACMTKNGVGTEVELRNGSDYRMYKFHEVDQLGTWGQDGVEINLRPAFTLTVQNASDSAVLDLVIRDRLSGAIKFQKSAAQFGVIKIAN